MSTITLNGAKGGGDFLRLRFWGTVLLMLGALLALGAGSAFAAPIAGTSIGNQASASYTDANSVPRITVSNSVSTVVQAVGAANLAQTQAKVGAPGQTLVFPHTIYNTGNGTDTFTITIGAPVTNPGTFSPPPTTATSLYADANCDGQADNNTVIGTVGPVAPGGQACFVAQATLATGNGLTGAFNVGYASGVAGATLQANGATGSFVTDSVTISTSAVINVTKSVSISTGPSGTIVTYQLAYRNTGTISAGNVVIADLMQLGATYVAGSGRWSVATGTALTDAATDVEATTVSPYRLDYAFASGAVIAIIERVDPGSQAIIQYQATMAGTGPITVNNQAKWCYSDNGTGGATLPAAIAANCTALQATANGFGAGGTPAGADVTAITGATNTNQSNIVPFFIPQIGATGLARITDTAANTDGTNPTTTAVSTLIPTGANVAGDDLIVATAGQGTMATWDAFVTNGGTGTDTFNITVLSSTGAAPNFPAGTTFLLFRTDGFTPLTDSNNDGVLDTGPVAAAATYPIRVVAILPPSGVAGVYDAIVQAQSTNTTISTNTVAVRANIVGSRVDLTNYNAAGAGYGGGTGFGEGTPQTTVTANPGTAATFGLIVTNTGSVSDSFDLDYNLANGTYNPATTTRLFTAPSQFGNGFTLAFYRDTGVNCVTSQLGAQLSNTGVIAAGANLRVCAVVTIPAAASAGNTEIFFRAISPTTFAATAINSSGDVKRDRLTVNIFRSVAVTPNNSGQIFPGGSIQYCHTVTNGGNVAETITVTQSDQSLFTASAAGWAQFATVYADTNSNCVLDGTETATPLTLTVVNAIAYAPGAKTNFIVVVQAPGAASAGQSNNNTFTLTTTAAPTVLTATANDITAVVVGQVQLVKDQRLDPTGTACSTTFDAATMEGGVFAALFTTTQITTGAVPGACIIYRVKATNVGTQNVTGVTINDVAPPNTALNLAPITGSVNACVPSAFGIAPNVNCTIATLTGGSTTTMYFRVKITP